MNKKDHEKIAEIIDREQFLIDCGVSE